MKKVKNRLSSFLAFLKGGTKDFVFGFQDESRWSLISEDWHDMQTRNALAESEDFQEIMKAMARSHEKTE